MGDRVYVAGNPHGLMGSFCDGLVSAVRADRGRMVFQMTAPVSFGSSGGPVVNAMGGVVGVTVGGQPDGENLNFAVHLREVLDFAQLHGFAHPAMTPR